MRFLLGMQNLHNILAVSIRPFPFDVPPDWNKSNTIIPTETKKPPETYSCIAKCYWQTPPTYNLKPPPILLGRVFHNSHPSIVFQEQLSNCDALLKFISTIPAPLIASSTQKPCSWTSKKKLTIRCG